MAGQAGYKDRSEENTEEIRYQVLGPGCWQDGEEDNGVMREC
jgi:hypothetical protein